MGPQSTVTMNLNAIATARIAEECIVSLTLFRDTACCNRLSGRAGPVVGMVDLEKLSETLKVVIWWLRRRGCGLDG